MMGRLLDRVNSPDDIKRMSEEQLHKLSNEIREYLVSTVSKTGGHLSSNLGVVELTVALHYVFDSPYDKIVWDVGHQSYVHKILTGRKDALKTIRQYGGISGFTKRKESEHDVFDVGHSSTSISGALGYAVARDIKKEGNSVIAVIGDGALTAGMALEALNNGARLNSNFIVILNDNQMSIARNVGGLAQYLDQIRTGNIYQEIKQDVHKVLDKVPVVGKPITRAVKDIKDGIKQMLVPGMFFEEIGFTYLGPIDGHNIHQTITVLKQARKIDGPVLVHLNTVKGKGYHHAENNPSKYHGIKPFDSESGKVVKRKAANGETYGQIMASSLSDYAAEGDAMVAISAAMPSGTGLSQFAKKYPKSFYDVGIAEQHAVTFAAGLALDGIKPYVAIYSSFLQRAYDQVLHDVCIQKAPVVFLLDRAGIVGEDGETHQGVFDLSYLNHIPNMTVMAPRDGVTMERMMSFARNYNDGPVAIRYPKGIATPECIAVEQKDIVLGQSEWLISEGTIAIVSVGTMTEVGLELQQMLKAENKDASVIDAIFTKPIDVKMLDEVSRHYEHLVIIEEGSKIGGYGSEVIRYMNSIDSDVQIHHYAINDIFIDHGTRQELLIEQGLDAGKIMESLKDLL